MSLADGIVAALALAVAHAWRRSHRSHWTSFLGPLAGAHRSLEPTTAQVAGKPIAVAAIAQTTESPPTGFRTRGAFRAR